MVLTRSKPAINYKEPSDDEMEYTNALEDRVATSRSPSQTKPKRKKAKTSHNSRTAGGSRDLKTSRMGDPFTPLPLDVVHEIFGFLTPLELLQLARTNKALRSYLMSKVRSSVAWKAARAAATPPVPICPKDLSEPKLAVLLFTKDCTSASDDYYLVEEVWKMSETVEQFQLRFEARVEGARQDFEQLLGNTKSKASERIESAKVLRKWYEEYEELQYEAERELKEARRQEIISKLVELGHDIRDARQASLAYQHIPNLFWSKNPLTTPVWKRIKPKAERFVVEMNRIRLESQEDPIKRLRRSTFEPIHEGIKGVIEAEGTDTSSAIFDDAFSELPEYLDKWRKERKIELTRLVLEARTGPGLDVDPQTAEERGILSLATSVFATCGYGYSFHHDRNTVHWIDSIGEHFRRKVFHPPSRESTIPYEEMQCVRVLPNLVDHVKLLVQAVGLDPDTCSAAEMDELDARFYCDNCSVTKSR
ncbi:hypothetical protein FRC01_010243, partial [Tulasnella sp. 417]